MNKQYMKGIQKQKKVYLMTDNKMTMWVVWFLWYINLCGLFNVKSYLYI